MIPTACNRVFLLGSCGHCSSPISSLALALAHTFLQSWWALFTYSYMVISLPPATSKLSSQHHHGSTLYLVLWKGNIFEKPSPMYIQNIMEKYIPVWLFYTTEIYFISSHANFPITILFVFSSFLQGLLLTASVFSVPAYFSLNQFDNLGCCSSSKVRFSPFSW